LSKSEKWLAALLIVGGIALTIVVLTILLTDGKWLIEESTTTGEGADKVVASKKYSDTLPLAAVGIGGLLVLCGAFFGRLREITLPGGAGIKLGDAKEHLEEKVVKAAEETARQESLSTEQAAALEKSARKEATVRFFDEVVVGPRPMAEWEFDRIASEAIDSAKSTL
jgi:hypothetical protein